MVGAPNGALGGEAPAFNPWGPQPLMGVSP